MDAPANSRDSFSMKIDHIGIAVWRLKDGIRTWSDLFGYQQLSPVVTNKRQKTRVVFLGKRDSISIKLIEPTSDDSPLAAFARKGGGLHHLAFRCDDLPSAIPHLKKAGARILVAPEPGEAFCGHPIAFALVPGNLNIELIDTEEKYQFGQAS